ncbi:C40 family peptidase [Paenibacillus sp. P96]|uniref:C40 family peptidase n=1 Tax=Paenibacillus zeirhizosphaerae TaxID=2987519 RepID=A0ABT9FVT9_9BACL|nr:C40 family peptidase [Paenibacillus sp. P96]MDP4098636.1 C40 family peptidase [Paenibacillus sp. P96]
MKFNSLFKKIISVGIAASIGFGAVAAIEAPSAQAASATAVSKGQQIVNYGKKYMGTPYKFGATTTTTRNFDCSSFTKYIFKKYGVSLPRSSEDQAKKGRSVSKSNLKVGDLLFFSTGSRSRGKNVTHVAVYAGNGKILHTYGSPGVTISDLDSKTWKNGYLFSRRVL